MIWFLLFGCGAAEKDACEDLSHVTWETFGSGFVLENCSSCHALDSPNRYGAPLNVNFDTHEQVISQADLILAVVAGPSPTMPPEGGVGEDDRKLLEYWLECGEH